MSVKKRQYKTLTLKQLGKVRTLTRKGKSQKFIAKTLGVSKQRVSTAQKKRGIGKRRPSPFWKDVKVGMSNYGWTREKATRETMSMPKWKEAYEKRTGKRRITREDLDADLLAKVRKAFKDITGEDLQAKAMGDEGKVALEYDGVEYVYLGEK